MKTITVEQSAADIMGLSGADQMITFDPFTFYAMIAVAGAFWLARKALS